MNICMILTNAFDPDPRVAKEAKTLTEWGHSVEILAWDRTGRYKDKPQESIRGYTIKRFYNAATYGNGYQQLGGYLDFISDVSTYVKQKQPNVLHCHDLDGLYAGYRLKKTMPSLMLVYDEHDLFYLYFKRRKGFINKLLSLILPYFERKLLRLVDEHIVVTPKMQSMYRQISNPTIVYNAPTRDFFTKINKPQRAYIWVGYIGSIWNFQELTTLIEVAKNYENIRVLIAGAGVALERLQDYVAQRDYDHVVITGRYHMQDLERLYQHTDVQYIVYPDMAICMPNKFFESIVTGTPVIASAKTEYGELVEKLEFGFTVENPNLRTELTTVLKALSENRIVLEGFRQRMLAARDDFYWESNYEALNGIYGRENRLSLFSQDQKSDREGA